MKKQFTVFLFLAVALALISCSASPAETTIPTTTPVVTEPVETTVPPTTVPPTTVAPETTEPVPQNDFGPDFQGMDITQLQYWFYDFSREYRLDELPLLYPEYGPWDNAGTYTYWYLARHEDCVVGDTAVIHRDLLEQEVLTHFGIIPTEYRSDPHTWDYDEDTETFSQWYSPRAFADHDHYMLKEMEYNDGIYTVRAFVYTPRGGYQGEEHDAQMKSELFAHKMSNVNAIASITISFSLDPETGEPLFLAFDRIRNSDFPRA